MSAAALSRTVAVLGASYGGARAAQVLAQGLPKGWRVVVIDRNSHLNHLYVLPRCAVVPGHEHKAFIPYTNLVQSVEGEPKPEHLILHAQVTGLTPRTLTLSRAFPEHGIQGPTPTLHFDYLVYALGSHLPDPINLWGPVDDTHSKGANDLQVLTPSLSGIASFGSSSAPSMLSMQGTKEEGINWLKRYHQRIEHASSVLVVGGGALGVQYATDIADAYSTKHVTLLHSRAQLLPRFDQRMHENIVSMLSALNVTTILGDRLDLSSLNDGKTARNEAGVEERVVCTQSGCEIRAGLIMLCTGQVPNTALLAEMLPNAIVSEGPTKGLIRVKRSMQIGISAGSSADTPAEDGDANLEVPYPYMFAIGDAADAFGATKSGRSSYCQSEVAAPNIFKLIGRSEGTEKDDSTLERYVPAAPAIKVSIGLHNSVYQMHGKIGTVENAPVDMEAHRMWEMYGVKYERTDVNA